MKLNEITETAIATPLSAPSKAVSPAGKKKRRRLPIPLLLCIPALLLHQQAEAGPLPELSTDIIQSAIDKAGPGDVIELEEGIYRGGPIEFVRDGEPGKPITLTAVPGATVYIKGSKVVDQWEAVDGGPLYRHSGWNHYFGEYTERYLEALEREDEDALRDYDQRRDRARNQLFVDGVIQREVARFTDLEAGTFHIDQDEQTIYLHLENDSSPDGKFIEVSERESTMLHSRGRNYLHIKNLNFEHLANRPQLRSMVRIEGSSHVVIDNIRVEWAAGTGFSINNGSDLVIRNSVFNHNGQMGMGSSRAVDVLVENSETSYNNHHPDKQYHRWEFGGLKITRSRNFVFDGHTAHDNRGTGIWFDIDNHDAVIKNSVASGNRYGIQYEISYTALIYNNILYNNRRQMRSGNDGWGIYIDSSAGCRVFNNITFGNDGFGIMLGGAKRSDGAGREIISHSNLVYNNIVAYNQTEGRYTKSFNVGYGNDVADGETPPELQNSFIPVDINRSDYNIFYSDRGNDFFIGEETNSKTLEKWQEISGQDMNSIWADPLFVDPHNQDFRLTDASPAHGAGADLSTFAKETDEQFLIQDKLYNVGLLDPISKLEPDPVDLTTFASWQAFHFPELDDRRNPSKGGPGGDPDGDGIPNLMEFALGLDPLSPSREGLPEAVAVVVETDGESASYMALTFEVPASITGITYVLEGSRNTVDWEKIPLGPENSTRENTDANKVRITLRDRDPLGQGSSMRFLRLRIEEESFIF